MKLLTRMGQALNRIADGSGAVVKSSSYMGRPLTSIINEMMGGGDQVFKQPYRQQATVYACVRTLSDKLSALPVTYLKGMDNEPKPATDPVLERVLTSPSSQVVSPSDLWAFTSMFLNLRGECIWFMVDREEPGQDPSAIMVGGPNLVEPVKHKGWIIGWKFRHEGTMKQVAYDAIIQFKYPNPYDPFRGLSPLSAAIKDASIDWKAAEFTDRFFKNGTVVSGVVELPPGQGADDEGMRRARRQFAQTFGGFKNTHKTLFLEKGAKYNQIQASHRDMEYLKQRQFSTDQIIKVFPGVSRQSLGLTQDYNKANSEQAAKDLHTNGVRPQANKIEWTLWSEWLQYRKQQTWLHFDDSGVEALQADLNDQSIVAQRFFRMGFSRRKINDRLLLGFEMDKDAFADETYTLAGLIPERLIEEKTLMGGAGPVPKGQEQIPETKQKLLETTNVTPPATLFGVEELAQELADDLKPILTVTAEDSSAQATQDILDVIPDPDDLPDIGYDITASKELASFFKKKKLVWDTIPKRWHTYLRKNIKEGLEAGLTIPQIAQEIEATFDAQSPFRAMRIARTEVSGALDFGRFETMTAQEVPKHGWLSSQDAIVREAHRIDGEVVKLGEPFSNGLEYPHDPNGSAALVVNCRCSCYPVYREGKTISTEGLWEKAINPILSKHEKTAYAKLVKWFAKMKRETLRSIRAME